MISYMSLLIFELSKMSNVLDFPINLEIIQQEIVNGQKYLKSPVGCIDLSEVDTEVMASAYQAALPSLEIMGSEENQKFIKLAAAVIEMRRTLSGGDLRAVMNVIVANESLLRSSPLIEEEVSRLCIELENVESSRLIEYGLKNGRYVNVVSIAKLISRYDRRALNTEASLTGYLGGYPSEDSISSPSHGLNIITMNNSMNLNSRNLLTNVRIPKKSPPSDKDTYGVKDSTIGNAKKVKFLDHDESGRRDSNSNVMGSFSSRRRISTLLDEKSDVSMDMDDSKSSPGLDSTGNLSNDGPQLFSHIRNFRLGNVWSTSMDSSPDHRAASERRSSEEMRSKRRQSQLFMANIHSSINSLKRAVAVASRVKTKSESLNYYLNAAVLILKLRENIVAEEWDEVRKIVDMDTDIELAPTAMEEILAVKEGLLYQEKMVKLTNAIANGGISGLPHKIDLQAVDTVVLREAIVDCEKTNFSDLSARITMELSRKLMLIRNAFVESRWRDDSYLFEIDDYEVEVGIEHMAPLMNRSESEGSITVRSSVVDNIALPSPSPQKVGLLAHGTGSNMSIVGSRKRIAVDPDQITVNEYIEDFLVFQEKYLKQLRILLDLSSVSNDNDLIPLSAVSVAHAMSGEGNAKEEPNRWLHNVWNSVCAAVSEVKLVLEIIKYRKIVDTITSAIELLPDPVRVFMGDIVETPKQFGKVVSLFEGILADLDDVEKEEQLFRDTIDAIDGSDEAVDAAAAEEDQGSHELKVDVWNDMDLKTVNTYSDDEKNSLVSFSFDRVYKSPAGYPDDPPMPSPSSGLSSIMKSRTNFPADISPSPSKDGLLGRMGRDGGKQWRFKSNNEDPFHLTIMHEALYFTDDYLSGEEEESDEIVKLRNTLQIIFEFRKVLQSQQDEEKLIDLKEKAKEMIRQDRLSLEHGVYEINAYINATDIFVMIRKGLQEALSYDRVQGYLDKLQIENISFEDLGYWIENATQFLTTGRHLCIGLASLLRQAKVIFRLRRSVIAGNWSLVDKIISQFQGKVNRWPFISQEFIHIDMTNRFRLFRSQLFHNLHTFHGDTDQFDWEPENNYPSLQTDWIAFEKCFQEFHSLLEYSSELLPSNGNGLSVSEEFFERIDFQSCRALWRLLHAICSKQWYSKRIIFHHPSSSRSQFMMREQGDGFLREFFGLDHQSDPDPDDSIQYHMSSIANDQDNQLKAKPVHIIERLDSPLIVKEVSMHGRSFISQAFREKIRGFQSISQRKAMASNSMEPMEIHPSDTIDQVGDTEAWSEFSSTVDTSALVATSSPPRQVSPQVSQSKEEEDADGDDESNVFHILFTNDWHVYPRNVKKFFHCVRNSLIDQYVRGDLKYFCNHGQAVLDEDGNVVISDLYFKFLQLALDDVQKVERFVSKYKTSFQWSKASQKWIDVARILKDCRECLVKSDGSKLTEVLHHHGFLQNGATFYPSRDFIREEVLVFERFAAGAKAEQIFCGAIVYLSNQSQMNPSMEVSVMDVYHVKELIHLKQIGVGYVREVLSITRYHRLIIAMAKNLLDCVLASYSGNLESLQKHSQPFFDLYPYQTPSTQPMPSHHHHPIMSLYGEMIAGFRFLLDVCLMKAYGPLVHSPSDLNRLDRDLLFDCLLNEDTVQEICLQVHDMTSELSHEPWRSSMEEDLNSSSSSSEEVKISHHPVDEHDSLAELLHSLCQDRVQERRDLPYPFYDRLERCLEDHMRSHPPPSSMDDDDRSVLDEMIHHPYHVLVLVIVLHYLREQQTVRSVGQSVVVISSSLRDFLVRLRSCLSSRASKRVEEGRGVDRHYDEMPFVNHLYVIAMNQSMNWYPTLIDNSPLDNISTEEIISYERFGHHESNNFLEKINEGNRFVESKNDAIKFNEAKLTSLVAESISYIASIDKGNSSLVKSKLHPVEGTINLSSLLGKELLETVLHKIIMMCKECEESPYYPSFKSSKTAKKCMKLNALLH